MTLSWREAASRSKSSPEGEKGGRESRTERVSDGSIKNGEEQEQIGGKKEDGGMQSMYACGQKAIQGGMH